MMESVYFKIVLKENESVKVALFEKPHFHSSIHFHPEYQLTMVLESTGSLLVQDKMCDFSPGDIFLIGPNIPHLFRNEDSFYTKSKQKEKNVRSIEIYFTEEAFGSTFLNIPEAIWIKDLLEKSVFGIKIPRNTSTHLTDLMNTIILQKDFDKILGLLKILHEISKNKDIETISLLPAPLVPQRNEGSKIHRVYEYVMKHYYNPISLKDVAEHINMSHYAFCRFFKQRTGKTFVQVLNEIRIGFACKHLVEGKLQISDIAYQTGFGNLSNFIRQFKKINGETPSNYQKRIKKME